MYDSGLIEPNDPLLTAVTSSMVNKEPEGTQTEVNPPVPSIYK